MLKPAVYFFLIGILASHFCWAVLFNSHLFIIVLSILAVISFFFLGKKYIAMIAGFVLALWFSFFVIERELNERILFSSKTIKAELVATVHEVQPKTGYQVLYFEQPEFKHQQFNNISHLRLTTNQRLEFEEGQRWQFKAVLKSPVGSSSWGAFDYEKWLIANDIDATGYIDNKTEMVLVSQPRQFSLSKKWKLYWQRKLGLNNGNEAGKYPSSIAVIYALFTADRAFLSDEQWQRFRDTGTSHLMAISGMHIGFIALIAYWVIKFIGRFIPSLAALRLQILGSFIICVVYGVLTGWQIPVQRAVLMLSIAYCISLSGLIISSWFGLALIALLVLLLSPMAIIDVSFWLSFSAVGMILFVFTTSKPTGKPSTTFIETFKLNLWAALKIQWALSVLLLPLTAYFFGYLPMISFVANLIAIPFISLLVMPSLLILFIVSLMSGDLFNYGLGVINVIVLALENFLALLSGFSFGLDFTATRVEFFCFSLLLFLLWIMPNPISKIGLCLLIAIVFISERRNALDEQEFQLATLDVGRGLSHVIQTKNHVLVYDLGEKWGSSSATERIVYPYLQYYKISDIDALVISHNDSDHKGDIDFFLDRVDAKRRLSGNGIEGSVAFENCHQAENWQWDGVHFSWLRTEFSDDSSNNASCVLLIQSPLGSALLTGDITKQREQLIMQRYPEIAPVDVLVTAHHGSKTSSSEVFLNWLKPQYAITSADIYNRYKHPAKTITERLERLNISHLQTGKLGSIEIYFGDQMEINTYREQNPSWWQMRFD